MGKGAWIDRCILQYVWIGRQDRGRAQAGLTIDLLNRQTMVRFEPDSVSVDDANDRNGNAEASCCYRGDAIKGTVLRRIENLIAPYCGNALGFVFRNDVHIRVRHGSSLFLVAGRSEERRVGKGCVIRVDLGGSRI